MSVATRLGRYRIGERIGSGGVAQVFLAEVEGPAGFAKRLVVKCLRPAMARVPELCEALTREAKLAQRLQHGNITQVFDFGVDEGRPYVVMELVDGCSLHELLLDLEDRGERMGLPEALFVVEEIGAALRYAHGLCDDDGTPLRIVHRDVKPRNVLVSRDGVVKLTDFGIAKAADDGTHTLPGVIKGTPAYLSPEQALAQPVDARTDLYALGLVLRELVLEAAPHQGPADPRVDAALRELVQRATADDPSERFADADAMLKALRRWRAAHEVDASPGRLAAWVRRARQQPPAASPVSLDAALRGSDDGDATEAVRVPARPAPRRRPWLGLALLGALAVGAATWAIASGSGSGSGPSTTATTPETASLSATRPPTSDATTPADSTLLAPPRDPSRPVVDPTPSREPAPPDPRTTTIADAEPSLGPPTSPSATAPSDPTATPSDPAVRRPAPRKLEPGRIMVNVLPWAEVRIDDDDLGRVPIDVTLPPGPHRVVLSHPQLGRVTKDVELRSGEQLRITQW